MAETRTYPTTAPYRWQSDQWQRLSAQWQAGRCPHALLLSGPEGLGKRHFADAFSELVLCEQPQQGLACGECRGCHLLKAGSHPDFLRIEPENPGGQLKIEQVRQLEYFVSCTSARGGARVVWMAPADAMNRHAANALLKTLEEPASSVILLLISDSPSDLLPTIRSRCQAITFSTPREEMVLQWLREVGVDTADARSALKLTGGAPLLAATLVQPDVRKVREQFLADLRALAQGTARVVPLAKRWEKPSGTLDLPQLLQCWQQWVAQMLRVRSCDQTASEEIMVLLQRLPGTGAASLRPLFDFYDRLLQARQALVSGANPNKLLLMEELMVYWAKLFS